MAEPLIKLPDAVRYTVWNGAQNDAWDYLDKNCPLDIKLEFQKRFRAKPPVKQESAQTYIYAKWSGKYDQYQNKIFGMYLTDGVNALDKLPCTSGQSYAQDVVHPLDDYSGSMRPLPEGIYNIGKLDDIGYDPGSSDGFGRWVFPLNPQAKIARSALLVHADRNRATSPGSAGCLCPYTPEEMLKFVTWMSAKPRPMCLVMDHGLGFLKQEGFEVPDFVKKP